MSTGNRSQKIKYLGVEMLKTDANKNSKPTVGLFRGFRERAKDEKQIKLILLGVKDKENDLMALNLAVFNVLSIKMLYGDTKELVVFKNSAADQEKAIEILEECLLEFQTEKRMVDNDPEIVDVATYENVPDEFFSPKKDTKATGTGTGGTGGYGYGYGGGCGYQNNDWQKKQKEREEQKKKEDKMRWTPFLFKRKGELPALKTMNAIKKKVQAVTSGEYEETFTDPDPKDTFVEKKTGTV